MRLERFLAYAAAAQEERPLYLFDKHFADKCDALVHDYTVRLYKICHMYYKICNTYCVYKNM